MGKELYNNKDNINDVSKLLGDLPKIDAPDNFEYNLMTKIQNKNFESAIEPTVQKSKFSWLLAPASVAAVTIVIMFFVFDFTAVEQENLLMSEPQKITELAEMKFAENKPSNSENLSGKPAEKEESNNETQYLAKRNSAVGGKMNSVAYGGAAPNKLPFNDRDAIDLDSYINQGSHPAASDERALIVGGFQNDPGFEGFMIQIHDAQLQALKAQLDSLQRVMSDSLSNRK